MEPKVIKSGRLNYGAQQRSGANAFRDRHPQARHHHLARLVEVVLANQ